jgi:GT2 family glycosyltransferase
MAAAPVVISIDDDAVFESARTVEQTLAEMDSPGGRVGAVAIPYIDVLINPAVRQRAPGESGIYVANEFRGTAHALRRDLFLAIGGYREVLTHQTEEGDYAIRMLAAGYVTRLGRADPIHHMESPRRDLTRQIVFNARNNLLFAWHNAPALWLLPHLGFTSANLLRHGVRTGYVRGSLRGIGRAYGDMATGRVKRQPVPRAVYELYRWMKKRGAARLEEIEGRLPPMKMVAPAGARA